MYEKIRVRSVLGDIFQKYPVYIYIYILGYVYDSALYEKGGLRRNAVMEKKKGRNGREKRGDNIEERRKEGGRRREKSR